MKNIHTKEQGYVVPLIIGIIAIILIALGIYVHEHNKVVGTAVTNNGEATTTATTTAATTGTNTSSVTTTTTTSSAGLVWKTYSNARAGYQVSYPSNFIVKENVSFPNLTSNTTGALATSFTFPTSYSTGTNLDSATVYIAEFPSCPSFVNGSGGVALGAVTSNGNTYSIVNTNDAASGGARSLTSEYILAKTNGKCFVIQKQVLYHDIAFLQGAGVKPVPTAYNQSILDVTFANLLATFKVNL